MMKKGLISMLLILAIVFSLFAGYGLAAAADEAELFTEADKLWYDNAAAGVGDSEGNPYQIKNVSELEYLAFLVNNGTDDFDGKYIRLSNGFKNVNSKGLEAALTTPIGRFSDHTFLGTFDGNYKTVSLDINISLQDEEQEEAFGLFGYCWNRSVIQNVATQGTVSVTGSAKRIFVGGVAGSAVYHIDNCSSSCTLSSNLQNNSNSVGGVVGIGTGATVGSDNVNASITGCSFTGSITADCVVGGIAGQIMGNVTLSNSFVSANISNSGKTSASYIGSVCGMCAASSIVKNCGASGSVTSWSESTGGLIGMCGGPITLQNCYTTCKVIANKSDASDVGGLMGRGYGPSDVRNCYSASGVVSVDGTNHNVGTLFGISAGTGLKNVYYLVHDEEGTQNDVNVGLPVYQTGAATETNCLLLDYAQMKAAKGTKDGDGWAEITVADGTLNAAKAALVDALNDYAGSVEGKSIDCLSWVQSDEINQGYPVFGKPTPSAADFIFTAPDPSVYDGTEKEATVTVAPSGSGIGIYTVEYYQDGVKVDKVIDAGTYTVKVNTEESGYFDSAKDITDASWKFTVAPKPITVTTLDRSKTYGDRDPVLGYSATGVVDGDTLTLSLTREKGEDAGQYTIFANQKKGDNANYAITFANSGKLTINKAQNNRIFGFLRCADIGEKETPAPYGVFAKFGKIEYLYSKDGRTWNTWENVGSGVGTYQVKAVVADSKSYNAASSNVATFSVKPNTPVPVTGDEANPVLWSLLLTCAILAVTSLLVFRRRSKIK